MSDASISTSLPRRKLSATPGQIAIALAIAAFLCVFLLVPVASVVYVAFTEKGTGAFTLINFIDFARTDLFIRSFWNSIYVAGMTVVIGSLFALPLAYITTRFDFRGSVLIQTLAVLPLIMPPFVGAVALQLILAGRARSTCCCRNGSASRCRSWKGSTASFLSRPSTTSRSS